METIKTILHPTDLSRHSQCALEVACALARDTGAHLIVLHTVPSPAPVVGPGDVTALRKAECFQQDLKGYKEEMKQKLERLPMPGLKAGVQRLLKEGEVAKVILKTAQDTSCDLIVMGTHGWTGEVRKLMGSVAEQVTQKASCPVVAVKAPALEAKPAESPVPDEVGVIL